MTSRPDIRVEDGGLTLYGSEITGTRRMIATLQREPQPMGRELEFSAAQIASLVISPGDQRNRGEHTGPAQWDPQCLSQKGYRRPAGIL